MFFKHIGLFATRYRIPIILIWFTAALIITLIAPSIEDVASSDSADFLPEGAPFAIAEEVYEAYFPQDFAPSNTIIVIDAKAIGGVFDPTAQTFAEKTDTPVGHFIQALTDWLNSGAAPNNIQQVITPLMSSASAELMVAPDNAVAIVQINLTTDDVEAETIAALESIDRWLKAHQPEGVETYQTGASPIVSATSTSVTKSVDRTIWVTVVLVVCLLLMVYRSPVSPLIPLISVTVAYLISRGVVAYIGQEFITITAYANVLLVVIMYGAGTDYCLFLISRFREEMAKQDDIQGSTERTVHRVGETISSSAGTIFVGFMAMVFAKMGIFNTTGPALALGIVISLLAGLTLVPALLSTLGHHAFWPGKATHRDTGKFYEFTSRQVSTYPLRTVILIVIIMLPLSIYALRQPVSYSLLDDLPDDSPAIQGFDRLKNGLGEGSVLPLTVIVTERNPDNAAAEIVQLSSELAALDGVGDVRSLNNPLGLNHPDYQNLLRVDSQLRMMLQMMSSFQSENGQVDLQGALAALAAMQSYLDVLKARFPVADHEDMQTLEAILSNPLTMQARQSELVAAVEGLAETFTEMEDAYLMPTALRGLVAALPPEAELSPGLLDQLINLYLTADGTAYKLEVIMAQSPGGIKSMDTVEAIRGVLTRYDYPGRAVVSGGTAINTDIRNTMNEDFLRAVGFVLLGIFIVLLLMLRSVVAPVYLIGTVILSFTFTLGLTELVFQTFFDVLGLTWYVPFFTFVFLVALGIDYSIFLFGRVKEEVANHGIREGVHVAVASTGAIITSAGIILAGTFAAMMTGEIMGLVEVGFAVSVGVLMDTFVVRTILDPALATLFGQWTWFPGGVPGKAPTAGAYREPIFAKFRRR